MNKIEYAPLNTTLSIYETELLDESDFTAMLQANSLQDALNILDKTVYEIPADVAETKNFETFLNRRLRTVTETFASSIIDSRLIGIFSWRYTFHNLKVLTKAQALDRNLDSLLIHIGMPIEQIKAHLNTGDGQNLPEALVESTEQIKEVLEHGGDLGNIDIIYDRAYLKLIDDISEELEDPQLIETTDMVVDFENLSTLLRCMQQNKGAGFVKAVLSDAGSISVEELVSYWENKDIDGLVDAYRRKSYGGELERILKEKDEDLADPVAVDAAIYDAKASFYRQFSLEPFGPMPVISYLHFFNNEVNNIRLILIGKDNGVPNKIIKERMRPIYGL